MTTVLKNEIRKSVREALREVFGDPEFGAPLSSAFSRRLKKSIQSAKSGRTRSLRAFLNNK